MRILFVHQNFPGQFKHLAPALRARGHDALAISANPNAHLFNFPTARYAWTPPVIDRKALKHAAVFSEMTQRAEVVAAAAVELRDKHGFKPDVVFGTPGWGETLFLKEVFPDARHLLYGEFFYRTKGHLLGFDPEFSKASLAARVALTADHAYLLLALNQVERILAPTRWQAQSFPDYVQDRITVVHDGVDTGSIVPDRNAVARLPDGGPEFRAGDELLTFINRNLEPHRGFHIFMRALPEVLAARPNAHVVIIGGDETSYAGRAPGGMTWKEFMLAEVGGRLDLSRVHFTGKVPYPLFLDLMRVARVHAYLTYPFVLSWSMLEAMSAGAYVIGSKTPPVEEVIQDGVNGRLVDFFDVAAWRDALIDGLAHPERADAMRVAARRTIVEGYDLKTVCLPKLIEFVEGSGV